MELFCSFFILKFPKLKPELLKPTSSISKSESIQSSSKDVILSSPVLPMEDDLNRSISRYDVATYQSKGNLCSNSDSDDTF